VTHSSRFTVAIHILTLLAVCGPEPQTSEFIAGSVTTNPVVIRRLLASLRAAGLVASQGGPGGGWHLLRESGAITLGQIFLAVEDSALFPMPASKPNPQCPVGCTIQAALGRIFQGAEQAMLAQLDRTTLAQLVKDVQVRTS
jgi:Rrf2 family protein